MNSPSHLDRDDTPMDVAAQWCVKLSDGELGADDLAAFQSWYAQPEGPVLLQRAVSVWRLCGELGDQPEIVALRSDALSHYHSANRARWSQARSMRWRGLAALAAVLMLIFAGILYLLPPQAKVLETGVGERRIAALADKSEVSLDASTQIDVRLADNAREVELRHGRAKFDVARDPLRPFRVYAGDKMIVAIGTSFSVELIGGEVRVNLYEGQVEVRDRNDLSPGPAWANRGRRVLTPGNELIETIGSRAQGAVIRTYQAESLTWEQGMVSFDGEPLASAVERINRYSDRKIRLGDSTVGKIRVDGEFEAGDTEAFVEGISAIYDLRVANIGNEVVLSRK